jgi:hypothetical protein
MVFSSHFPPDVMRTWSRCVAMTMTDIVYSSVRLMDDSVKRVAVEWVLTNGVLPGFKERLDASLPSWASVGDEELTVYRSHGHSKAGIVRLMDDPSQLRSGLRPVLATSLDLNAVKEFAGDDCCIFVIHLRSGVRYLDITAAIADAPNSLFEEMRKVSSEAGRWPHARFPIRVLRQMLNERVHGIPGKKLPEKELLVYENGEFSGRTEVAPIDGKRTFELAYQPKVGGRRGRTFRTKTLRRNKHGRRSTRQSKHHVRDRHAGNR